MFGNDITESIETIRQRIKQLIKEAKSIISSRKNPTALQLKKETDFANKISQIFVMNRILPTVSNPQPSTSAQNLEIDFGNRSLQTENEMMPEKEDSSDVDYQPSETDNDSDSGSDEKRSIRKQKLPPEIIQKIALQCGPNASYRIMSTFIGIGIEIAGGDPKNYCMSKSELHKQLSVHRENMRKETLEKFSDSNSKLLIHFDTKCYRKLNKSHLGLKNRLVVIFRGEASSTTIGPIEIDSHEASLIAGEIINLIVQHNLRHRIIGFSCDTERTNTGHLNGVCVRIERFLEKDLLYCMCRHHIFELIPKHLGEYLFGAANGPTFNFESANLRRKWESLNFETFEPFEPDDNEIHERYSEFKNDAIQQLLNQKNMKMARDDYAELTDLALKFFGLSDIATKQFMVPSSISNARWMARDIYVFKSYLFRDQLNLRNYSIKRLERFSMFNAAIYVKYWNRSTNIFDAPINDLCFIKEVRKYEIVDKEMSEIALKTFQRHLNYLSDELVVLSIFSNRICYEEKEIIRRKLNRNDVGPRTNCSIQYIMNESFDFAQMDLVDFINDRSMYLFKLMQMDVSFLDQEARTWDSNPSYQSTRKTLKNLLVPVNDCSESVLGQTAQAISLQKAQTEINLQKYLSSRFN